MISRSKVEGEGGFSRKGAAFSRHPKPPPLGGRLEYSLKVATNLIPTAYHITSSRLLRKTAWNNAPAEACLNQRKWQGERMQPAPPCQTTLALCRKAARLLTGAQRRSYQAECAQAFCQGSARAAETLFGWRRDTVALGLHEARSGITCPGNFGARGGKKLEALCPRLEADIRALVDPHSQADAQLNHYRLKPVGWGGTGSPVAARSRLKTPALTCHQPSEAPPPRPCPFPFLNGTCDRLSSDCSHDGTEGSSDPEKRTPIAFSLPHHPRLPSRDHQAPSHALKADRLKTVGLNRVAGN